MSLIQRTCTIAAAGNLSDAIPMPDGAIVPISILMSADWTVANLAFHGSIDGTNYYRMYDVGGTLLKAIVPALSSAPRFVLLGGLDMQAVTSLKIQSIDPADDTAEAQAAARTLTVIFKSNSD